MSSHSFHQKREPSPELYAVGKSKEKPVLDIGFSCEHVELFFDNAASLISFAERVERLARAFAGKVECEQVLADERPNHEDVPTPDLQAQRFATSEDEGNG